MDLRANTAVDVLIGPFVDKNNGNTTEDGLTLTAAEIKLSKNGQALTLKSDVTSAVFDDDGYYNCELDATDTNTEGNLVLIVHQSANALPVRHEFNVLSEAAWDSLYVAKDTGFMDVNVKAVSDDETAADNLELMYDGTGYDDETGPSSRLQVDNLGAASGAALSYEASADNTGGAIIDGVTIVGSITANLFTDTDSEDGVRHQLTHATNAFDFVYRLPVGGNRTGATVEWRGYLTSSNDACSLQAYDHIGASWDTIATISGTNGTVNGSVIANLLSKHTGTGAEIGNVYIRFVCTAQTSPVFNTDLLLVQAVNIGQSVGYANGQVWINTNASNTNTESFVDGVADNPVSTIVAAKTISTAIGLGDFHVINGSTITLAESTDNESYFGDNWTLALGGQSVAGAHFTGAIVSGVAVGAAEYFDCVIGAHTTIANSVYERCSMNGTVTLPVGSVFFDDCHHSGAFVLDFGALVGNTTVHCHKYAGGLELHNFGDTGTDILHLDGKGKLTINANSSGGTINIRGNWEVVDNSGTATIIYDDLSQDASDILVDTADMQPKFAGITLLAEWLGAMAGSQVANATALTEIQATGAGSGTYDEANESLEAIRARGDSAWAGSGVTLADGAHGGSATVITAERIVVASTTAGEPAVKLEGNTTGAGLLATGGATAGHGLEGQGGGVGSGISGRGGVGSNTNGMELLGDGSGHGLKTTGGVTGDGIAAIGGATSGDGLSATKGGTGKDINGLVDLGSIFGTALTEGGAGRLAAAFVKLLDVATPLLVASDVMRGTDSAALASVCTEPRLAELDPANIPTDLSLLSTGQATLDTKISSILAGHILFEGTADSGSTTTLVDAALTEADTDYWNGARVVFTSGTIAGQVREITVFTPGSDQITFSLATTQAVGTNTYKIIPGTVMRGTDSAALASVCTEARLAILSAALTEAYAADGSTATMVELLYMIWSHLHDFAISGTVVTSRKLDGLTTAMTHNLDSSTVPTDKTRAT
jgi:hypothetical protein